MKKVPRMAAITWLIILSAACGVKPQGSAAKEKSRRPPLVLTTLKSSMMDGEKRLAMQRIEDTYSKADFHLGAIVEAGKTLAGAERNWDAIAYTAELMGKAPFHTETLRSVAEKAASARMELPEFKDIAELAVIADSGGDLITELAERAALIDRREDVDGLRVRIREIRDASECKTVDEAIARFDRMMKELNAAIKEK